jgi:hypothetical protein
MHNAHQLLVRTTQLCQRQTGILKHGWDTQQQ